jgi:DMSO/TMAO reductase YedYZ molybdopterin-dependent catalytic subunit
LPPGQRRLHGFPRFGTHLSRPAPEVPAHPVIEVVGAGTEGFDVPLATLADLPRREVVADFHCVAGWSATDLHWEGVAFAIFFDHVIAPALAPGTTITHVVFHGLDGFRSTVTIEDASSPDVLIAEHLDGRPLDSDHGAPVRLVSPAQYGYMSTKHLCRLELCTSAPRARLLPLSDLLIRSHPRARVWQEERHGYVPGWLVRPLYLAMKPVLLRLCARGTGASMPAVGGLGRSPGADRPGSTVERGSAQRSSRPAHGSPST